VRFAPSEFSSIIIPSSVETLESKCFADCESLSSITFELNSRLTIIESKAFSDLSFQSMVIPMNIEILGSKCFSRCYSLSSITFGPDSKCSIH
jgi:hypothetical protein